MTFLLSSKISKHIGDGWSVNTGDILDGSANDTLCIIRGEDYLFLKQFRETAAFARELNALLFLPTVGVNTPDLVFYDENAMLLKSGGQIVPPLQREEAKISLVGQQLANLHIATHHLPRQVSDGDTQSNRIRDRCRLSTALPDWPQCFLHGDLTWGNIVQADDRSMMLIDYEEAGWGHPLMDLATAIIECCWDATGISRFVSLREWFLRGYIQNINWIDMDTAIEAISNQVLTHAAIELLEWSRKAHQVELSAKYTSFLQATNSKV